MKSILTFLTLLLLCNPLFSQTMTDSDGNKTYRGNISLIVKEDRYIDGKKQNTNAYNTKEDLNSATYAWVANILIQEGFKIVNRDAEAMKKVAALLRENKMEEYINGLSVQAKGQGADWLLLVDMTTLVNDNKHLTLDYSYRLISVENNIGNHAKTRQDFVWSGEDKYRADVQTSMAENKVFFTNFIRTFFPVQFSITSVKGKELKLQALQYVGALTNNDKLYIYRYEDVSANFQGELKKFNVLTPLAIAKDFKLDNGYLVAKADNSISDLSNTFACLTEKNALTLEQHFFATIIGLPYDDSAADSYQRKMVNQSVYCALGKLPQFYIIESDMLSFLKKERELQKTEEFMDGYTVQQLKAVGAQYLIHVSNFSSENDILSFTLSFLDVASNTILKTFECKCLTSKLDEVITYYMKYVFTFPCSIQKIDSKSVEALSLIPIGASVGDSFLLTFIKPITNTATGTTTNQRVEVAELKYEQYCGMKHRFVITKVLSKEDMSNINKYINTANFFLLTNDKEPDMMKSEKKSEMSKGKPSKESFLNRLSQSVSTIQR